MLGKSGNRLVSSSYLPYDSHPLACENIALGSCFLPSLAKEI